MQPSDMVYIPGGQFKIGSPEWVLDWLEAEGQAFPREWFADETPQSVVEVSSYWIDRHPVTVRQFEQFIRATGYETDAEKHGYGLVYGDRYWEELAGASWRKPAGADASSSNIQTHPVVHISWNDAMAYANWHSKRLPTEPEWELAARGFDFRLWPWGNEWHSFNANTAEFHSNTRLLSPASWRNWWHDIYGRFGPMPQTTPVGSFRTRSSPFGTWDMAGNVYEWTGTLCHPYGDPSASAPIFQQIEGIYRVIRGGSWMNLRYQVRCSERMYGDPTGWSNFALGFRCARDAERSRQPDSI